MHHAPFHHKQHERTHVCSTTLKVSRPAEAARTTRSTETATAEAALILLLSLLLAGALGKHGLEYLGRFERLLEFGIIPLLNLQTLLQLLGLLLLALQVGLYTLSGLLVGEFLLALSILPACLCRALTTLVGGKHLLLVSGIGSEETFLRIALQTEVLGQPFARLGYQLCALGLTTLVGLLVLGLHLPHSHQAQSGYNQHSFHSFFTLIG